MSEENNEKEESIKESWAEKHGYKFAIGLLFFAVVSPFIFTQTKVTFIDFTDMGTIGATFNGLMSPFIAMASAYLFMFLS